MFSLRSSAKTFWHFLVIWIAGVLNYMLDGFAKAMVQIIMKVWLSGWSFRPINWALRRNRCAYKQPKNWALVQPHSCKMMCTACPRIHSRNVLPFCDSKVELDLLRTLPGNKHYEHILAGNVPKLRRVLLAFAQHDPVTGYCQVRNECFSCVSSRSKPLVAVVLLHCYHQG